MTADRDPHDPRNPQAEQMADASMLRTLAAQASAIWPQEEALFERYSLPARARIVDVGCGSGQITRRLAERYPAAELVGVDILEGPLAHARTTHAELATRLQFVQGDAFDLDLAADTFDLVVCRHMTQAVPSPDRVLAELLRVCKPGGWIHVLSEDYGMLHFPDGALDPDRLWTEAVGVLARATGTDERVGRKTWTMMNALGLEFLRVDYVVVDTLRVPRETFAEILRAWRDGYSDALAQHGRLPASEVRALFDYAIATILDESQYSAWHVPIVSGHKPASAPAR